MKLAPSKPFGIELIIDLHGCNARLFTKSNIKKFFIEVCRKTKMKRHGEPLWWVSTGNEIHLQGTSAVQFIETSNIVCHTVDPTGALYINIFTCKPFRTQPIVSFAKTFWRAQRLAAQTTIIRR